MFSMGICRRGTPGLFAPVRADAAGNSAPKPRPSPRGLFTSQHLLCECCIGRRAFSFGVEECDRSTMRWRFRQSNAAWNSRAKNKAGKVFFHFLHNLHGEIRTAVEHGNENA